MRRKITVKEDGRKVVEVSGDSMAALVGAICEKFGLKYDGSRKGNSRNKGTG